MRLREAFLRRCDGRSLATAATDPPRTGGGLAEASEARTIEKNTHALSRFSRDWAQPCQNMDGAFRTIAG